MDFICILIKQKNCWKNLNNWDNVNIFLGY